jgi:predicted component of type VI protein secretion system
MKCPNCGKENPAGEKFCLDCGSDLSAPAASTPVSGAAPVAAPAGAAGSVAMSDEEFQRLLNSPPAARTCPHCGAAAPASGSYCDSCGQPLDAQPAPAGAASAAAAGAAAATSADSSSQPTAAIPAAEPPSEGGVHFDLSGPAGSSNYTMSADEVNIGRRDPDAGIFPEIDFDGNDVVVDGGERVHAVSRRHARIFRDAGELKFEDLGSTNGSTLNGSAVLANDPQPLHDGDRIVLGRTCRIAVHVA